ncbi:hypothetical protein E4665_13135 [Sporolactobacillus shoreae]|uniref:YdeI/OmpD-associated family protein n=1 Tax=Sporolactobacillus shoreae TaxID=1465501 RepID=A0A4Z0GK67_9BACL|nr:YdeI/OmpD-associated family protein [Sporolactobacillus shoreae]TGA97163.1 hypothetical protein E4665_13135 [Sporolactobacillus shoreae]
MAERSIVEKLKLDKYQNTVILNLPESEFSHFSGIKDFDQTFMKEKYDLIFAFTFTFDELKETVLETIRRNRLQKNGYLYLAYPKKGNKIYSSFVHRDELFPGLDVNPDGYIGKSDIKFARMVSLDEVFTIVGLKEAGSGRKRKSTSNSQCVDDYISYIPRIESYLSEKAAAAAFYQSLTPGYRKDWARYVFSAKQETTRDKRLSEMEMILGKGFKSKDLYRQSQQK